MSENMNMIKEINGLVARAERVCATNEVRSEIQTARAWPWAAQHGFLKK